MRPVAWLAMALLATPVGASGQSLAQRVAGVYDGVALISYTTRAGVEFCRSGVHLREERPDSGWDQGYGGGDACYTGPARVELDVRDGAVERLRILRPGLNPARVARDLGETAAGDAARYLLALARTAPEEAGRAAIFAAELANADGASFWRGLLGLARGRSLAPAVRKAALFWLGQEAGNAVTVALRGVASDGSERQDVRDAAIFALSQRPGPEPVSILMDLARTAPQAATRRTAMFWLSQSDDPRVPGFFERILLGRAGG